MASGSIMKRMFTWKTIRKKFLKNSKTSAKKYLQPRCTKRLQKEEIIHGESNFVVTYHKTPMFGDKSLTVRIKP